MYPATAHLAFIRYQASACKLCQECDLMLLYRKNTRITRTYTHAILATITHALVTIALDSWYMWCPYKNMKTFFKYSIDFGGSKWRHDNLCDKYNQELNLRNRSQEFFSYLCQMTQSIYSTSHNGFKKEMLSDCENDPLHKCQLCWNKTILLNCKQNLYSLGFLLIFSLLWK